MCLPRGGHLLSSLQFAHVDLLTLAFGTLQDLLTASSKTCNR